MNLQPVSPEKSAAGKPAMPKVIPLSSAIGAEIRGIDLADIDTPTFDFVHRAWLDHCVLLFRDQHLSDEALVDFSRRFGELDIAPPNENGQVGVEGYPEVLILSNVIENGKAIGALSNAEAVWHTDMNYIDEPPTGSVLSALEIPPNGGDTGFCNMYRALEELPEGLRDRIEGLSIKHDSLA